MKNIGLYIHIPFCLSKCPYCDFYSVTYNEQLMDEYCKTICEQLEFLSNRNRNNIVDTVYFGGGTPILMGETRLNEILKTAKKVFRIPNHAEITLEANPCLVTKDLCESLVAGGFNRISMGVQSLNANELKVLGRRHDANTAIEAIKTAHSGGFQNISADLMLATPLQTPDSLNDTIEQLLTTPITHISAYLLKIEPGTAFFNLYQQGAISIPSETETEACYHLCVSKLKEHGFLQYEISNFAKPGYESKHNLKYWRCEEYLGIGPYAHSYINGERLDLNMNVVDYMKAWETHQIPFHLNDIGGSFEEELMLRLRLTEGVNINQLAEKFDIDITKLLSKAKLYKTHELLTINNGIISLTPKGFLLSNEIITELLCCV